MLGQTEICRQCHCVHYRVGHSEIHPDKARKEENSDLRIANLIAKLVLPLHYRILRNKLSLPAKAAIKPAQAPYDPNTTCKPLRVMSGRNMAREHSL